MADRAYWINMRTGETIYRIAPVTSEDCVDYIPQSPSAQALYQLYIEHTNLSPFEAMVNVLTAACGEPKPFEVEFSS